jgi:NAD-dependent deacetylase
VGLSYNGDPERKPKLVILSGAGLSADSGIATFRGATGLWEGHSVDQVANGMTWKRNWDLVRRFYNDRRVTLSSVKPNLMHRAIAAWEAQYNTVNLTQNVDDLLERAGCNAVIHLHGFLTEMCCEACGHVWTIGYATVNETDRCPGRNGKCGSVKGTRPNIVFFNEPAPNYAVMYKTFRSLAPQDCVVVIGTSGLVINVNSLVFDSPAHKILNNLEASEHINDSYFDHVLYGTAESQADTVSQLIAAHMNK